jgi:uncharacterized protein (DUF433 family)
MRLFIDANMLFSLREAAVLSQLPEDRVRREVERKIIRPRMAAVGSAHRLLFAESEILFFAMLHSLSGIVELSPPARAAACRLLIEMEPVNHTRTDATKGDNRSDAARVKAWTTVHRDIDFRDKWVARLNREWSKSISAVFTLNWDALLENVAPRIDLYREGLHRICEDDEILRGEPTFRGTRLAVRHIGGMRIKGEPIADIVRDYPDLDPNDVEFARLYTEAHPIVGRPKSDVAHR